MQNVISGIGRESYRNPRIIKNLVWLNRSVEPHEKGLTAARMHKRNPGKFLRGILEIAKLLSAYYPEQAEHYTGADFMQILTDLLVSEFGNIMPVEMYHAVSKGLITYKYHTGPKPNEIAVMISGYCDKRAIWVEEYESQRKKHLNAMHDRVISTMKNALKEVEDEREEARKEERRELARKQSEIAENRIKQLQKLGLNKSQINKPKKDE